MPYSERLAERVRALLSIRHDVDERRMFGGLTFMVGGHMCCGVHGDELIEGPGAGALGRPRSRPRRKPNHR
jgi:TfoX N-terminal domain